MWQTIVTGLTIGAAWLTIFSIGFGFIIFLKRRPYLRAKVVSANDRTFIMDRN